MPRNVIALLLALSVIGPDGATYRGIAYRLGLLARNSVRGPVRIAEQMGFVRCVSTGRGPKAKVVVYLTARGAALVTRKKGST